MTDAPERIWAWAEYDDNKQYDVQNWSAKFSEFLPEGTAEYIRADVHAAEVARLTAELEKANNEFGSQTAAWPDLWRRIAQLKELSGERYRRAEAAEAEVARLREAQRQAVNNFMAEALGDAVFGEMAAEVARLRDALEPFSRVTQLPARHAVPDDHYFAGTWLTWGDIRRAREVMGIGKD